MRKSIQLDASAENTLWCGELCRGRKKERSGHGLRTAAGGLDTQGMARRLKGRDALGTADQGSVLQTPGAGAADSDDRMQLLTSCFHVTLTWAQLNLNLVARASLKYYY